MWNLLHKDQLHASAFYNGHLQIEIENSKQLYYIYIELYICIYNLLHKDQLHVSAFYNGHLQIEIENSKQLYYIYRIIYMYI